MKKVKFLIIGSGPTGLGAAFRLKDLGEGDYLILERNPWVGGLAASFRDDRGFTWDIGGHVQFSHYKYFDDAMDLAIPAERWLHHERESWVWMKNRFVPYPFQNNIGFLPKESMWRCLKGLIDVAVAPAQQKPLTFHDWIVASFGEGIAEEFMLPYNFKVWAYPPHEMNYQWIGERVATVNLHRIVENVLFDKMDASWGPNNMFRFPPEGGTGAIWESIANHVGRDKIILEKSVREVVSKDKKIILDDGTDLEYEYLLSTIPLDIFTSMVRETSTELRETARRLRHSTSNIIGLGFQGKPHELLRTKCWMYFPEPSVPFYRMTVFSNYSPKNVPDISQQYSLMCEVSESPAKPVDRSTMIQECVDGLYHNGLIPEENKLISRWSYSAEYGYPTPSVERDQILKAVIPPLDRLGAYSRGRFGGWKYEVSNQDHSFMQGVEWVNHVVLGEEEKTFRVDTDKDPNLGALKR